MITQKDEFVISDVDVRSLARGLLYEPVYHRRRRSKELLATAKVVGGNFTVWFSRWHDEQYWFADCQFTNGLPAWSHGTGSRSRSRAKLRPVETLAKALNERLASIGGFDGFKPEPKILEDLS